MKIKNVTSKALVIHDELIDSQSQYQSGIKAIHLAPNGTIEIPNTIAGESATLQALLASGEAKIVGTGEALGGAAVPGVLGGKGGGPAFMGLVRTQRLEAAVPTFRIMFGTPVAGDEIVDMVIAGYKGGITGGDIIKSADAALDLVGVTTCVAGAAAVSTNLILTFTSASVNSQAGYTVWAPQA